MNEKIRKFLPIILIFYSICITSQVNQDFSSNTTHDPSSWSGNWDHFQWTPPSLRLKQPGKSGVSYISHPYAGADSMTWEFRLTLDFNPSAYNLATLTLHAPSPNIATTQERSIKILLGGRYDALTLYHEENKQKTTLINCNNRFKATFHAIRIVVKKEGNKWSMSSQLSTEESLQHHGSKIFNCTLASKGYLGAICQYTKTYSERFYFYSFKQENTTKGDPIDPPEPEIPKGDTILVDTTHPTIPPFSNEKLAVDSIERISDAEILLFFNQHITLDRAYFLLSEPDHQIISKPTQYPHIVYLSIDPQLDNTLNYSILWHNIYDLNGDILDIGAVLIPSTEEPKPPTEEDDEIAGRNPQRWGEIILTEIMANPNGCILIPEEEYVEIFNTTNDTLYLGKTLFGYHPKFFPIDSSYLAPRSYAVLCHRSAQELFAKDIQVIAVSNFPTLANSGKLLSLKTETDTLLHMIEYDDSWYRNDFAEEGGYSLELIRKDRLSSSATNWHESIAPAGGTPGKKNSLEEIPVEDTPSYVYSFHQIADNQYGLLFERPIEPFDNPLSWIECNVPFQAMCLNKPYHTFYQITAAPEEKIPQYLLLKSSLQDIDQQVLLATDTFWMEKSIEPSLGSVVINEFLLNNSDEYPRFIELHNSTNQSIELSQLIVDLSHKDGESFLTMPLSRVPISFQRKGYVLLSPDPTYVFKQYGYHGLPQVIKANDWSKAIKDETRIRLLTKQGHLIDSAIFFRKAYLQDEDTYTSLERISYLESGEIQSNWIPGDISTAGATPGYGNRAQPSKPTEHAVDTTQSFSLLYPRVSLDPSLQEHHLTILYNLPDQEITKVNIELYTDSGIKVADLANQMELQAKGSITLYDSWKSGLSEQPGIYILLISQHRKNGYQKKEKRALPITP